MSLLRQCSLLLSVALLTVVIVPQSIGAAGTDKNKESKKKKKERDAVRIESVEPAPVVLEPAPIAKPTPRRGSGSLYSEDAPGGNLVSDFKAQRVGDLVFIDVVEESTATVSSSAKRNRDSGTLGGMVGVVGAIPFSGAATTAEALGGLGARKFEGKGETDRRSRMDARVTARVVEVLPNGDMRVEGQKIVKINKEDELMTLSGIVRRRDITANNAVPTTMMGDMRVTLNGRGVASADNAPGWLYRLFEKISPF